MNFCKLRSKLTYRIEAIVIIVMRISLCIAKGAKLSTQLASCRVFKTLKKITQEREKKCE
jgi:hypothetical protein